MQKYVISFDIDGTLLKSNGEISDYTINILKELKNNGHKLVLNTGRYYSSANLILQKKIEDFDVIAGNGSHLYLADQNKTMNYEIIPKNVVKDIIDKTPKHINIRVFTTKGIYTKKTDPYLTYHNYENKELVLFLYEDLNELLNHDLIKISLYSNDRNELEKMIENLQNEKIEICFSDHLLIDITKEGISKGSGLKQYQQTFYKNFKTIAFGDNDNDLEHLKHADISVAVSNATSKILNIAQYKTKSNDEDGCAIFLKKFFA